MTDQQTDAPRDERLLLDRIAILEGDHVMLDNPFTRKEMLWAYELALNALRSETATSREAVLEEAASLFDDAHVWMSARTVRMKIRALKSAAPQGNKAEVPSQGSLSGPASSTDRALPNEPAAAAPEAPAPNRTNFQDNERVWKVRYAIAGRALGWEKQEGLHDGKTIAEELRRWIDELDRALLPLPGERNG